MGLELRPLIFAGLVLAVGAFVMLALHDQHYRARREKLLEARLRAVEEIVRGDHRL